MDSAFDLPSKISNHILNFLLINVVLLGFAGNFLCYRIFNSSKMKKYSIAIYFRAISFFDSLMLIQTAYYYIRRNFEVNIIEVSDFFCKFKFYFFTAVGAISPWILVAISFDRFLKVVFPNRLLLMNKSTTQIGIIIVIVVYNFGFYSFMTWNSRLITTGEIDNYYLNC